MKKVLILCTGNSCRSIMAEALINAYLRDNWQAFSAGVSPSKVNPRAITIMQEIGIDINSYRSKSVSEFLQRDDIDLVVTVCDNAKETCPVFLKPVKTIHIGFEDPADYNNEPDEIALPIFRKVRNQIKIKLFEILKNYV
ncbi:MAG: arsenate reductase ArsC [Candidatus Cloacimonetes bacterium]|nr:arsenate reductase ArsC [Candidatus Cloacimonadota bacterium]MDD4156093.1 arsenate reductase ArsC [Candidatus Cloacimonadota bacterium]